MEAIELKLNDVYTFRYSSEYIDKYPKGGDPYHCFDGQLVVKEHKSGLILVDTYWTSDNRTFTLEEALLIGELRFKCNLDLFESGSRETSKYYNTKDYVDFSHQHGCYKKTLLRIGAVRSKDVMIESIDSLMDNVKREIIHSQDLLERLQRDLELVKAGDLSIWI